jgi:hypothetical protein
MPPEPESELSLPQDLLSAVQRHLPNRHGDLDVESWQPSFMERMFGFLDRGRSRE